MSGSPKKLRPTVSIIGTGRLGSALAVTLAAKGYPIGLLVARHRQRARKIAALLDVPSRALAVQELDDLGPTDVLLIATPDDQISEVVSALLKIKSKRGQRVAAFHTSGALSSAVLSPLANLGWDTGSIHPLVSVTGPSLPRGAFWCVEGNKSALRTARKLVRDLEGKSFSIDSRDKPLYHAAAVMTSGNVTVLFDVALGMLGHCGLNRTQAQRILLPLLESTVRNLEDSDPAAALTGTFSRGDIETVRRHLEAMSGSKLSDERDLYRLLGKRALKLAMSNGLKPTVAKRIETLLASTNTRSTN